MRTNTPEQKEAIRKLMANRRRELAYQSTSFPKFKPGMTTSEYLQLFGISRPQMLQFGPLVYHESHGLRVDLSKYNRPAPMLDPNEPEVVCESQNLGFTPI